MNDKIPTQGEWNVLSCLWERAPMTAMELAAALEEKVGWAKSTTLTTLRRMEEKGLVKAEAVGRARHYTPAVERQGAAARETRSFLDKVYRGSVGLMVSSMVEDKALSRDEIDQLYEILRQAEEGSK